MPSMNQLLVKIGSQNIGQKSKCMMNGMQNSNEDLTVEYIAQLDFVFRDLCVSG